MLSSSSDSEVEDDNGAQASKDLAELLRGVIQPLSKLKVDEDHQGKEETEFLVRYYFLRLLSYDELQTECR